MLISSSKSSSQKPSNFDSSLIRMSEILFLLPIEVRFLQFTFSWFWLGLPTFADNQASTNGGASKLSNYTPSSPILNQFSSLSLTKEQHPQVLILFIREKDLSNWALLHGKQKQISSKRRMVLKSSRALLEPNMWYHVFKYETVDAHNFLFACETSSCHSFNRSILVQSKLAICFLNLCSKKRLYNSNTSLSANSISSLPSRCFFSHPSVFKFVVICFKNLSLSIFAFLEYLNSFFFFGVEI